MGNCDGSLDYRDTAGWFNLLAGYCRLAQKKKKLETWYRSVGTTSPPKVAHIFLAGAPCLSELFLPLCSDPEVVRSSTGASTTSPDTQRRDRAEAG